MSRESCMTGSKVDKEIEHPESYRLIPYLGKLTFEKRRNFGASWNTRLEVSVLRALQKQFPGMTAITK